MSDTPSDTTAAGEEADPSASPPADRPGKLRLRIAGEAGRMLAERGGDARRAGFRAARRMGRGWVPPQHLPDSSEIRRETERALVQGSDAPAGRAGLPGDRFDRIAELVRVLGAVKRDPVKYPEGDALEHSLQVFARVSEECPWDEELLTAALVHDVGLAIDRANAVAVALEELADLVTVERIDRTLLLLEDGDRGGNRAVLLAVAPEQALAHALDRQLRVHRRVVRVHGTRKIKVVTDREIVAVGETDELAVVKSPE